MINNCFLPLLSLLLNAGVLEEKIVYKNTLCYRELTLDCSTVEPQKNECKDFSCAYWFDPENPQYIGAYLNVTHYCTDGVDWIRQNPDGKECVNDSTGIFEEQSPTKSVVCYRRKPCMFDCLVSNEPRTTWEGYIIVWAYCRSGEFPYSNVEITKFIRECIDNGSTCPIGNPPLDP